MIRIRSPGGKLKVKTKKTLFLDFVLVSVFISFYPDFTNFADDSNMRCHHIPYCVPMAKGIVPHSELGLRESSKKEKVVGKPTEERA